ncbi:MAG: histidine kinase dimerization/phosphoacceptor domain -containing protein [Chitinophagaceae bacterium]
MRRRLLFILLACGVHITAVTQERQATDPQKLLASIEKSKPDTTYIRWLLELSNHYLLNSHDEKAGLDSSLLFAKRAETVSSQIKYAKGLGNSYMAQSRVLTKTQNVEKGKEYINKAINVFTHDNCFGELGEAYHELGTYYSTNVALELKERIRLEELALSALVQSKDTLKLANIYRELGDLSHSNGDFPKSLIYLKTSLNLYQVVHYPRLQGIYDLLGTASSSIGDYKEAIRYGLLAVEMAEADNDTTTQMATFYNRIGMTYNNMKDFEKGLTYFKKGIPFAERNNDQGAVFILTLNITRTLIRLNKPQEALVLLQKFVKKNPAAAEAQIITVNDCFLKIYLALKQYPLAQKYYEQLASTFKNDTTLSNYTRGFICRGVIQFLFYTGRYTQLPYYLQVNKGIAEKLGSLRDISENHLWWFRLDSAQGRYPAAIAHYQQYKLLNDSLFNETKSKQIAQLQIQYETEKKDQDLKLKDQNIELLTKREQLQEAVLHQARTARNMVLGSTIFLSLLLALGYNRYRLKQKSNEKLQAQQKEINQKNITLQQLVTEKEWLVKEIHHRVKNNFHIVQGLLGTQSEYLKSDEAINALADSRHRVEAMSLIHQKLYQSDSLSAINMADYIHELVNYLRDSIKLSRSIQFNLQIEPIELGLSHCIPLGLIMNEAITNAIKYAFPGNRNGVITIQFKRTMPDQLMLLIADNGVGLPADFNMENPASMGMRLMRGLSEDIDATFNISCDTGTEISLYFKLDPDDTSLYTSDKKELSNA